MTTFLFWNLKGRPLAGQVARLSASYEVDVIVMAECRVTPGEMMLALRRATGRLHYLPPSTCQKIAIYTPWPERFLQTEPDFETDRATIRRLLLPEVGEILLVAAHLPSKLHCSESSQEFECVLLGQHIRQAEAAVGHRRTVLVGDLNVDPFEKGVVSAAGLHGVMTRAIAERRQRTVQGEDYPFFYNPMWSRLGDKSAGPPGTYYDNRAEQVNFFWHTFDQVLVRPDLLPAFENEELKVLTGDNETKLISAHGLPDDSAASDHLPVLFKLQL